MNDTLAPNPLDFTDETIYVNGKYFQITAVDGADSTVVDIQEVPGPQSGWAISPWIFVPCFIGGLLIWIWIGKKIWGWIW